VSAAGRDVVVDVDADPPFDDDAGSAGFDDSPDVSPVSRFSLVSLESPSEDEPRLFAAARRSFFAQPDPLKWIAGAANAFRTGPLPQSGQCSGAGSSRPWMTSNRRPQAAQS
jgi:hypothetical protein